MSDWRLRGHSRAAKSLSRVLCVVVVWLSVQLGRAADITWIGGNGGWDTASNWDTATVPGDADRAIFNDSAATNDYAVGLNLFDRSVGDILFSAGTKGIYWKANSNTLTVANSFVMDQPGTATALGRIRNGIIAVTNATGTAVFKVGDTMSGGKGLLVLEQQATNDLPTLVADQFLMTTNSTLTFSGGTLTILHGSTIDRAATTPFDIGATAGQVANWIMLGGTNSINYAGSGTLTRLGLATGSSLNVTVGGSNTLWAVGGTQLTVGHNGQVSLAINNGARVTTKIFRVGNNAASASNCVVTVNGAGSRLEVTGGFTIGNVSSYNQMTVTNGAQVIVTNGFATVGGGGVASTGNVLRVTGAGSVFQVFDLLQVGSGAATADASNRVEILNGAVVRSASSSGPSRLGGSPQDPDNSALVDGANSLWEITGPQGFQVGGNGPGSVLTIASGGKVTVDSPATTQIGNASSASNSVVIVTGSGSQWITGTNGFNVGNGSFHNTLIISNGAEVVSQAGLIPVAVGAAAAASNNVAIVTGSGSRWDINGPGGAFIALRVGSSARNNELNIRDGATVVVSNGIMSVGANLGADGNTLRVSGAGSLLEVSDLLQIGAGTGAKSNAIEITAGAVVRSRSVTSASRVGRSAGDDFNRALIDGVGSLWEVAGSNGFVVANDGNNNTLTVQNGGALRVTEGPMFVGALANSGNAATITSGSVTVTNAAGTGVLSVRVGTLTFNGGTIAADYLRVTEGGSSSVFAFNSGLLAIAGSAVTNGSAFAVGNGVDPATLKIVGGTNSFTDGLIIANNATLAGVGHIEGAVTLANGATWAPGLSAGTQTVTGAVVLNAGTTLDYELGAPGADGDRIEVDGDLTLDGTLNVTDLGGFAAGTYALFSYTGNLTDNTLNIGTLPGGFSGTISNDTLNKLVLLNVTGGGPSDPFALWQFQYFGSTNCATCGGDADFDGDGISNTNEFLAGTVPTNTVSGLRIISATRSGNDITVTWSTAGGRTNILQVSSGTANGSFTNNFTDVPGSQTIVAGSGDVTTNYTDAGGATNGPARYYRIRLAP